MNSSLRVPLSNSLELSFKTARAGCSLIGVSVFFLLSSWSNAAVTVYEGFAYDSGTEIAGLNGGIGWSGAWNSTLHASATASTSGGTILVSNGAAEPTGGIAVINITSGIGPATIDRDLSSAIDTDSGGTIWFSLRYLKSDVTNNTFGETSQFFRLLDSSGEGIIIGQNNSETTVIELDGTLGFGGYVPTQGILVGKFTANPSGIDDLLGVTLFPYNHLVPTSLPTTEPNSFDINVRRIPALAINFSVLQDSFPWG
ncbi:MAG: hypothetical protein R3F13_03340 [Prosthecobacter sp.]